jgi:phage protein D
MIRAVAAVQVPQFSVDDVPSRELDNDCLSVEVVEGEDEFPRMLAEFLATATDATRAHRLEVDQRIRVILGTASRQRVVFAGLIATIAHVFDESTPPRTVVEAERASPTQRRRSDPTMVFDRAKDLLSARVMVGRPPAPITVTGETSGWPGLALGRNVRIEGIGASFSGGGYRISRFTHTFDPEVGLRSTFEAKRAD